MSNLQNPIFQDETKAREWLEARVWPSGPVCPHCGVTSEHVTKLEGSKHRPGLYQCSQCREQFTVTVKTVFERSHIPLTKWLAALFLLTASKKGVSAHQIHRSLGISYKSSWFMMHRLREALRTGGLAPMGGAGKTVEADETFIGKNAFSPKGRKKPGVAFRNIVLTLVERGGSARSFHIEAHSMAEINEIVRANVHHETAMNTDEGSWYNEMSDHFASHDTVNHKSDEYVRYWNEVTKETRPDGKPVVETTTITTNTVEGFYSVFKRGMKGVYQHCSEKHLHRYLAEYDFRYSNRVALG